MGTTHRTVLLAALAVAAIAAGACKKRESASGPAAEPEPSPASPQAAPAPAADAGAEAEADADSAERQCFVALKRPWGTAVRSFRGVGTREQILRQAQLKACGEIGVVEATCTEDLFEKSYEGCVGDPQPVHVAGSGTDETAAAIRSAIAAQADAGAATPAADLDSGIEAEPSDAGGPPPSPGADDAPLLM